MALLSLQCRHCGAPLPPGYPGASLTCAYCGTNYVVPNVPAPAAVPPQYGPPEARPAPRRSNAIWVVFVLAGLLGLGAVAAYRFLPSNSLPPTLNPASLSLNPAALLHEWYSTGCLVDANGDQTLDVAGLSAMPGSQTWRLGVVDGNTGASLFSADSYDPTAGFICVTSGFFGIDDTNFKLTLYSSRDLGRPLRLTLADHLTSIGIGNDCFALSLQNEQQVAISRAGAPVSACKAEPVEQPRGYLGLRSADQVERQVGSATFALTASTKGTPFLELAARTGERQLWQTRLRYVRADGGLALLPTPKAIMVFAGDPRNDDHGVVVGIDPATGAELYAVREDSHWSGNVRSFEYNGRFAIAMWGFGLHAYDPATGQRVWHIGGR